AGDAVQKIRNRLDDARKTADKLLQEQSDQITKGDRLKLDYLAEEIEATQATALKSRDLRITGMRSLLGLRPEEPLEVAQESLPDPPPQPALEAVLRRALEKRPEVHATDEAVKARQALVDLESARLWPDIALAGGARFTETTNASNPVSPFVFNPYHEATGYVALALHGTFEIPEARATAAGGGRPRRGLLAALQAGSASAAVQQAQERVRKDLNAWFKAQGPARQKAREQARAAVGELIDFDTLAKSTLGRKWNDLSSKDRARYTEALRGAMEANYLAKMRQGKTEDVDKIKSEVLGEEKQGDNTLVKTQVKSGEDTAAIDYVMSREKRGWRAVDVLTEGVSLAETYRDQVTKLMAKKNFEAVITALVKKRKALEAQPQ